MSEDKVNVVVANFSEDSVVTRLSDGARLYPYVHRNAELNYLWPACRPLLDDDSLPSGCQLSYAKVFSFYALTYSQVTCTHSSCSG